MPQATSLQSKKIILVEDDQALLKLLASVLREVGYEAVTAATGRDAMELLGRDKFGRDKFDLAVLDYGLPDMFGTEVAVRFQTSNPGSRILFITGRSDLIEDALLANDKILMTWGVLQKPFLASAFIGKIEEMLARKVHV